MIIKIKLQDTLNVFLHFSGYAVNFQKTRHEKNDILFHFNPRGKTSHVVLNTVTNSSWGEETKIEDENVAKIYFESPFKLKIVPIKDNLIHVYVNDKFKTEYECKERKITDTSFIIFSPFVSIHPL